MAAAAEMATGQKAERYTYAAPIRLSGLVATAYAAATTNAGGTTGRRKKVRVGQVKKYRQLTRSNVATRNVTHDLA